MTLQYEQKGINFQVEMGVKTFLFDADAASQTDVVFNNWDSLLSMMQNFTGKKEILFAASTTTIPPGTYDMTDIIFVGTSPGNSVILDNVILNNFEGARNIALRIGTGPVNTAPVFSISGGGITSMQFNVVAFLVSATAAFPFFDIDGASTLTVINNFTRYATLNPGAPVFNVVAGSFLKLTPIGSMGSNDYGGPPGSDPFITGLGGVTIETGTGDVFFVTTIAPIVPTVVRASDYEEAVPANWSLIPPLNVKTALDRIAAAIGPIA